MCRIILLLRGREVGCLHINSISLDAGLFLGAINSPRTQASRLHALTKAHAGLRHLSPHDVVATLDAHIDQHFFLCSLVIWNKKLKMTREKMSLKVQGNLALSPSRRSPLLPGAGTRHRQSEQEAQIPRSLPEFVYFKHGHCCRLTSLT